MRTYFSSSCLSGRRSTRECRLDLKSARCNTSCAQTIKKRKIKLKSVPVVEFRKCLRKEKRMRLIDLASLATYPSVGKRKFNFNFALKKSKLFWGNGKVCRGWVVPRLKLTIFLCCKGSSQNFARRGQTKELSYRGEGVWTRFVVRSTVKKKKEKKKAWSSVGRSAVLTESNL